MLSESTNSCDGVLDVKLLTCPWTLKCAVTPSGDVAYAFDDITECIKAVNTHTGATW